MSETTKTLGTALPEEQARVRALMLGPYTEIGQAGAFARMMMEQALQRADRAVMNGDIVAMLQSYEELKSFKG